MSLKIDASMSAVAYHKTDGAVTFPYAIDAHQAVSHHPDEWSKTPWLEDGEKSVPTVEIPEGWEDMKPTDRINLAIRLTGAERKGLTAAKADEIIAAEAAKRDPDAATA